MDRFLISPSFLAVCLLTQVTEKLLEVENETMMKVADLEKLLLHKDKELQVIRVSLQLLMLLRGVSLHLNACVADSFQMHTAKLLRLQIRSSGNRMFVMCEELWLGAHYSPLVAA